MKPLLELGPPTQRITYAWNRYPWVFTQGWAWGTSYLSKYSFAHVIGNAYKIFRFSRDYEEVANKWSSVFYRGHFGHCHASSCTMEHLSQWYYLCLKKFKIFLHYRGVNAEKLKIHNDVTNLSARVHLTYLKNDEISSELSDRLPMSWTYCRVLPIRLANKAERIAAHSGSRLSRR